LAREDSHDLEEVFLRNDDLAGLVKYYEAVAAREPNNVAALERLAGALRAQGRGAEARDWLEKALTRAPRRRDLRLALIDLLTQAGDVSRAAAHYETLDKQEPHNPDVLREWGRLVLRDTTAPAEGRRRKAAEVWLRMLPAAGRRPDAALTAQVAELFREAGLTDDALDLYRKAVGQAPATAAYRIRLGEYLLALKRPEQAQAAWAELVAGERRTAANLRQLAEVQADFGFRPRALATAAEAVALEPREADLRLFYAHLLRQEQQYAAALKQLDEAERLVGAGADDQERVLQDRLRTLQAAGTLNEAADGLARAMPADAAAGRWYRLARHYEAARQWSAATGAIRRSLGAAEADAAARLLAWRAAARIHEGAGNLQAAVEAYGQLARLDRRARADHLAQVVRLETKLGRREPALEAGRKLLEASPDNLESYRLFADLCFQVGDRAQGLEVLRRAIRVNPNDAGALTALAAALADQFQADAAIQLYWRAFDRKDATPAQRLDVIGPLAELYLGDNRFDKLLERLRRQATDAAGRQAAALFVAEAYKSAGDLGSARQELESLLAEAPDDLPTLRQLASLAEREGDLPAAARYTRRVLKLAAADRAGNERLALLLARSGEVEEAAALWQELAGKEKSAERLLPLVDRLFAFQQYDRALELTRRALHEQPRHWEALYREGVALARLDRPGEAEAPFRAILALREEDDKPGHGHAAPPGRAPAAGPAADFPINDRVQVRTLVAGEAGLSGASPGDRQFWSPADFGQARMAALGWLLALAQRADREDEFLRERRDARDPSHK
ncbi:MAG TPA: tetratricopeptide repeat protein, partial [Gemmataceae bacterium]|nr:tetratricopeptide repeat protein [Gemmataceae bacterium]